MNKRHGQKQAGFTAVDFLMTIVCVILLALILSHSGRAYKASFRDRCWDNQKILETILLDTLVENQQELFQVLAAYVVFDPDNAAPHRMVICLNPRQMDFLSHLEKDNGLGAAPFEEKPKDEEQPVYYLVKDLDATPYADRILCPLREGERPRAPSIDYLFVPTQRWYCMHHELHN